MPNQSAFLAFESGDNSRQGGEGARPEKIIMAEQLHPLLPAKSHGASHVFRLAEHDFAPHVAHARIFRGKFPDDIGGRIRRVIISDDDFR